MADKFINLILRIRQDGQAVLSKLKQEAQDTANALGKVNGAGGAVKPPTNDLKKFTDAINGTKEGADRLYGALKNLALGFAGIGIVTTLKHMADGAARTQTLGTVLEVVAVNAGITVSKIREVDAQVQKLGITSQASKQALTAFIQAGLDISKAAPLARAAQDLAVIANKNSSELFENIVLNIQQLDTQGLRYNGVVLDMDKATDKYAKTIGKTASELSKEEKQQATLIAVLEKAKEVQGVYEKSLGEVGKQLQSLKRYQQEASESIGKNLLPAYRVVVEEFTTFLKQSKLITDEWSEQGSGAQALANNIRPIAVALRQVAVFITEHIGLISELVVAYVALSVLATVTTNLRTMVLVVVAVTKEITTLINTLKVLQVVSMASLGVSFTGPLLVLAGVVAGGAALWALFGKEKEKALDSKKLKDMLPALADLNDVENALASRLRARLELIAKMDALQSEIVDLEKSGNLEALKAAKERQDEAIKRRVELEYEIGLLKQKAKAEGGDKALETSDRKAKEQAELQKTQKAVEAVDQAFKDLKVSKEQSVTGLDISDEFKKQLGAARTALQAFQNELRNGDVKAVNFGGLRAAFATMVDGAKTTDELNAALRELDTLTKAGIGRTFFQNLLDTAKFKRDKAAIDEVKKSIEGYTERVKRAKEAFDLAFSLSADAQKFTLETRKAFADLGAVAAVGANGMVSFFSVMGQGLTEKNASLREEIALFRESKEAAFAKFQGEILQIDSVANKSRQMIQSQFSGTTELNTRLVALDRDTAQQRLTATKAYYDQVRSLQQQLQQAVVDSASKIKGFEEQRLQLQLSKEKELRTLRQQGMSEEQKKQDDLQRISVLSAEVEQDLLQKRTSAAKRAADDQLQIAQALAGSAKTDEERTKAAQLLEDAYANQNKVVDALQQDERERGQALTKQLNEATQTAQQLTAELTKLSTKLSLDIDTTGFEGVVQRIRSMLQAGLQAIPVSLSVSSSTPAFAEGGRISGPGTGTSDSILMWGSNGEFMMNARATQYYGEAFMDRINRMQLPRFAQGGAIGGGATKVGEGEQSLNLTINGRSLGRVRGNRQTIRDLTDALVEVSRGA